VEREVEDGAAAERSDDIGAPAILGEGVGDLGGHGQRGGAPQVVVVLVDHVLAEVELADAQLALAGAVGRAEHEAGHAHADVAGVLRVAEGVPALVAGLLEHRLEVLELGDLREGLAAEHVGVGVAEEGHVGHRTDGREAAEELDVLGAGAEVVGEQMRP
jgi:hypothetical protein